MLQSGPIGGCGGENQASEINNRRRRRRLPRHLSATSAKMNNQLKPTATGDELDMRN